MAIGAVHVVGGNVEPVVVQGKAGGVAQPVSGTVTAAQGAAGAAAWSVEAKPPTACYSGVKAVTTAGTDVVLGTSQALKAGVQIKAHAANTGTIYVGPEGVASATGYRLAAGEAVFVAVDNVADVWIDSSVNGEGVSWIAA